MKCHSLLRIYYLLQELVKKWTEKQRKANEAYHENLKNAGIKLIPWNKGIPLAQETKDKMHNTIVTKGNKNKVEKLQLNQKFLKLGIYLKDTIQL